LTAQFCGLLTDHTITKSLQFVIGQSLAIALKTASADFWAFFRDLPNEIDSVQNARDSRDGKLAQWREGSAVNFILTIRDNTHRRRQRRRCGVPHCRQQNDREIELLYGNSPGRGKIAALSAVENGTFPERHDRMKRLNCTHPGPLLRSEKIKTVIYTTSNISIFRDDVCSSRAR
jgi:hypothetical protein